MAEINNTPSQAKPATPLAKIDGFVQDGEFLLFEVDGVARRVHRVTPVARAYLRLRDAALTVHWEEAIGRAQAAGVPLPQETATIFENEKKPGLLKRLFGKKSAENPQKPVTPSIPDYAATGAAIGVSGNLALKGFEVTEAGTQITLSDDTVLKVDPKGDLARETVHLLEELDAIGIEKLPALEKMNADLGRPMVRLASFSPPRGVRQSAPAPVDADVAPELTQEEPIDGPMQEEYEGLPPFTEADAADREEAPLFDDSLETEAPPQEHETEAPSVQSDPVQPVEGLQDPEHVSEEFIAALAKEGDEIIKEEAARLRAEQGEPADPDEAPADSSNAAADAADASAAASQEAPADEPEGETGAPENDSGAELNPQGVAAPDQGASPPRGGRDPHWSEEYVRLSQPRLPNADGPFTLAAKGEQMVDGKFPVFGEINVSHADYEVIRWLARSRREARYLIEITPEAEGSDGEGPAPVANVVGVKLQNESQVFTPIDWKKCREEFEAANKKVQLPERRDAEKSVAVQTQLATGVVPGAKAPASAKEADLNQGPLPLPKLRPLSVPKADPSRGGPSMGR